MQNNKKKKLLHGTLIVLAALAAFAVFTWYANMNTASMLYGVGFERQSLDTLLEQDAEWLGTAEEQQARQRLCEERDAFLAQHSLKEGSFFTETAASLYVNAGTELPYSYLDAGAQRTVVLLHAYGRSPEAAAVWMQFWYEQGFNVLLPTARGYTEESTVTAMGWYEQYDLYDLLAKVSGETGVQRFTIHGEGAGANAALFLTGSQKYMDKLRQQNIAVELVVADSAYATLQETMELQLERQFGLSGFMIRSTMASTVNKFLGFFVDEADAVKAVSTSETPTLFVAGEEDSFLPAEMSLRLYEACAGEKEMFLVPGARHGMTYAADPDWYEETLTAAISRFCH